MAVWIRCEMERRAATDQLISHYNNLCCDIMIWQINFSLSLSQQTLWKLWTDTLRQQTTELNGGAGCTVRSTLGPWETEDKTRQGAIVWRSYRGTWGSQVCAGRPACAHACRTASSRWGAPCRQAPELVPRAPRSDSQTAGRRWRSNDPTSPSANINQDNLYAAAIMTGHLQRSATVAVLAEP